MFDYLFEETIEVPLNDGELLTLVTGLLAMPDDPEKIKELFQDDDGEMQNLFDENPEMADFTMNLIKLNKIVLKAKLIDYQGQILNKKMMKMMSSDNLLDLLKNFEEEYEETEE